MQAYKKYIIIEDPSNLVLSNLPFQPGQRVEVIILAEDNPRTEISNKFRELCDRTQAIPGIEDITEEDIALEIDLYRRGE